MPRFACVFCACVFVSRVANAQQPPDPAAFVGELDRTMTPAVTTWLKSADPRTQAWGAYMALRDKSTAAEPVLLEILANFPVTGEPTAQPASDSHDAMLAVLDAIIQLGAQAPAGDAQRIYPEFPVQSLILLSRSGEQATPALFSIFSQSEQRWPAAWLASGNLLASRNAKGFAAAVIAGMTVHAVLTVRDPGADGGYGGSASCCGVGSAAKAKAGWPPVGIYQFGGCGASLEADDTVLAPGTDPAIYRRKVNTTYAADYGPGCGCNLDFDLTRQHYLSGMVGASVEDPPIRAHVSRTIVWRGLDVYRSDLASFIADEQSDFTQLAKRLAALGRLSDEEAKALRPALHIVIGDQRDSHDPALPALEQLPSDVTIERM